MSYPYATINDVMRRYRPIFTLVGSDTETQVTSDDVSSVFIADAQGYMDAFLRRRYVCPVPAEPLITQIASDLAIFNMLVEKLPEIPDYMQARKDRADEALMSLAKGEMQLDPNSATVVATGDNEAWSSTMNDHAIVSPVLGELNQTPDLDRVQSELDERAGELGVDPDDGCL